jgi:hypothetical protein
MKTSVRKPIQLKPKIQPQQKMKTKNMTTPQLRGRKMIKLIFTMLLGFTTAAFTGQALAQGTWETKMSMPSGHYSFDTGVVNGIIYAVGGDSGSMNVGTTEAYDPASDTWTTKMPMPTARAGLGVGVVNGILYAVGGVSEVDGCGDLNVVEAYDPATNTWTTRSPMTTTQGHLAVGVVTGILYAVGGTSGNSASCSGATIVGTLQAYDPATDTWTTKSPMPTARYSPLVGVVNGILYAAGGYNMSGVPISTVEAYDPASDTWTTKASLPAARGATGGGVINGILYAAGGANESGLLGTDVAYNPASDTWTAITPMPTRRAGLSGSVVNNVLYALGGADATGVLATNEAFTPPRCPHPQGYWKTNPGLWPVTSLVLGSQTYTNTELLSILKSPTTSDASIILARQLIAAKLNIANGSDPAPVSSTITDADSLLSAFSGKLPYKVKPSSATGQMMVNDANTLNSYNNGLLTPVCSP